MLLTGEADYLTPITESEPFYQALKPRQVDTLSFVFQTHHTASLHIPSLDCKGGLHPAMVRDVQASQLGDSERVGACSKQLQSTSSMSRNTMLEGFPTGA